MAPSDRVRNQPKSLRAQVNPGTEGSYLWAPFAEHMKAAMATLIPLLLLQLVATAGFQTGSPSIFSRLGTAIALTGQYLVTWGWFAIFVGAVYCAAWAFMSSTLVRLFRLQPSVYVHLAAHAIGGAVGLLALVSGILALAQNGRGETFGEADYLVPLLGGSVVIGAIGSMVGMWVLKRSLHWYVTRVRPPLPDVFTFVEGKHDKGDYERL